LLPALKSPERKMNPAVKPKQLLPTYALNV
jgi:hypothetical protein